MLAGREAALAAAGPDAGEKLASRGLPVAKPREAAVISAFHPYLTEISTLPLLAKTRGRGLGHGFTCRHRQGNTAHLQGLAGGGATGLRRLGHPDPA